MGSACVSVCVCVYVRLCRHACALVFYHKKTIHYIKIKCVLIRHYVAKHKVRNSIEQKTASMPEKSVFKAKKQTKCVNNRLKSWNSSLEETLHVTVQTEGNDGGGGWDGEKKNGSGIFWALPDREKVCCSGLMMWALTVVRASLQRNNRKPVLPSVEWALYKVIGARTKPGSVHKPHRWWQ